MIDYELVLVDNGDFKAAVTSNVVDLGQKNPDIGMLESTPLYFVFTPNAVGAGDGSVTFTLEDSENGTDFAPAATFGPVVADNIVRDVAIKFPLSHRRYVRVSTAVNGTITTLGGTLAIGDAYSKPAGYWRDEVEFFEPNPDAAKIQPSQIAGGTGISQADADGRYRKSADKVSLTADVSGILPVANGGTGKATAG